VVGAGRTGGEEMNVLFLILTFVMLLFEVGFVVAIVQDWLEEKHLRKR